jgi:proteic killer suppression protein
MAIRSFADRDTETVWQDRRVRRFQRIQAQAKRKLNVLNAATMLEDLRNNPGARLHRLRGDRAGQWAIAVNEQYRIVFDWNDGPTNVELTDYHR